MAALIKTIGTVLQAPAALGAASLAISSVGTLTTSLGAVLAIWYTKTNASALTVAAQFRVEGAWDAGQGYWVPLTTFSSTLTAAVNENLTGTEAAGSTVLEVASTTGLAAGDWIAIVNGTIANSEFARIVSIVTDTSITLEEGIVNAQTGSTVWDQAEAFVCQIPAGIARVRVVANNLGNATQTGIWQVRLNTVDSIG